MRTPDGNQAHNTFAARNYGRPVLPVQFADTSLTRFILKAQGENEEPFIFPKLLCFLEIKPMFLLVAGAFVLVILKFYTKIILFLFCNCQHKNWLRLSKWNLYIPTRTGRSQFLEHIAIENI